MEKLIKLAEKIKDPDLRKKTIELLKDPSLSNPEVPYTPANFSELPAWIGDHHFYPGGLADHTYSVTKIALETAKHFEKLYGVKINTDYVIAGALLHDIMKVVILSKEPGGWGFTGCLLDHAVLAAAELYARKFPEEVIHIVASHGGELGAAAAAPRTIEAQIVFCADFFDTMVESFIRGKQILILREK
ncbi:MAG: HDIG domain-containing protein [Candidatus Micrarchaeota archaeon]|nr:HDIG domain-containing protein [Candidatus Micrarchaeota archaeon]